MCRRVWICGVTRNKNVISLVPQGTQSQLKEQNTLSSTPNFVTKLFMVRQLLTSNFFTSIVHRLFIWHVPLSVNLWRHDKQCDNSGSTRHTKSIETAKILCLKRWISLRKCLWCAIYWWVIVYLACVAEREFVASREKRMWYPWFYKVHQVDWKGKWTNFLNGEL